MNIVKVSLFLATSQLLEVSCRDQGCGMLILVDDTVSNSLENNEEAIRRQVDTYVSELNEIYQNTILRYPPNNNIYFFIEHLILLRKFLPACSNKGVLLNAISRVGGTADYCLVHLLLTRDIGCVEGLGNLNGLCKRHSNTAWSKVHIDDKEQTVNTIAHEVGHNFGSEHDGGDSSTYRGCSSPETMGIMGGVKTSRNFSTCSLSAMHWRLQQVLKAEPETHCFTQLEERKAGQPGQYEVTEQDMSRVSVPCPADPDPDCPEDQPDPPPPDPPEPVCGDKKVDEPGEECDCGKDWAECEDPCCYPATLTKEDLATNSSALPCTRNTGPLCRANPGQTFLQYGLLIPFLVILVLVILVALALVLDWRLGRRRMYTHITERQTDRLHIENEAQRDRRLGRNKY